MPRPGSLLIAVLLLASPLWCQTQNTIGTSRTTTPEEAIDTSPVYSRPDPFGNTSSQRIADFQRPVVVSGRVLMEDGSPPPEPVVIERVCFGQPLPEGYTNSKGEFQIQLGGDPTAAMMDASIPQSDDGNVGGGFIQDPFGGVGTTAGGLGRVNPLGCELRAVLAGYHSEPIALGRREVFDNPDVGTIVLTRLEDVEGSAISFTSLEAPKKARKAYEKAFKETQKKKPNLKRAIKALEKAVEEYPEYAAAWTLLGELRMSRKEVDAGRQAFEKAISSDERYVRPYGPLMWMALQNERWQDAARLSGRALKLNPFLTEAQYCHAVAQYRLGNVDASQKAALAVQSLSDADRFPETNHLLGLIYTGKHEYAQAAQHFRKFLAARPNSPVGEDVQRTLVEWEALGVIERPNPDSSP